ncbi:helix-turn-helix domain-containing protein [Shinella sp. HZN7]|uniref:helix-turn-helix domain-containing protein n=1 Tax=Shinella sp. (strain HZN7) TaxID=879274 RepID=UPI0007DA78E6|nr:XRE family transcriptional regulator [Shinella sp. HZN7]ANH08834.1 Cro/Cl family transcriptional regulator [Shinella sp. HZN7]
MSNILHSQERTDVLAHVSGNLRRLRLAAGLSQTALAEASGLSRRMIVALEAGEANISLSSLDRLAAAMGADFVELVRDPTRETRAEINAVTWRGEQPESAARLLCSAPAAREAQMWLWTLGPGDSYMAEPDPDGWHEMLFVVEGTLRLTLSGVARDYATGGFVTYSTAQPYSYANGANGTVRFVRNVLT